MISRTFKFLMFVTLFFIGVGIVLGQEEKNNQSKMDVPETLKENLAKRRIKQDEEDFQDLIKRCEEAIKLSEDLISSFEENNKLSSEDTKKLEKLEKVVKKIRRDLGAEDDKEELIDNKFPNPQSTLSSIKEKSANLLTELKKTGRFAISVIAVESSNTILRLVKFLRFKKN